MDRPAITPATDQNDDRDALLMNLVESALARSVEERPSFLETVQLRYPELFAEVKDRVAWEARMGGFLREPLMAVAREGAERPFSPDELIAGRFRILRELGRGGMGVVYEAADEKLHRRIAIKCARKAFQSRLTPEARAALEVSHPNVCKLHELHTAQTADGPVDFLTMEFIEGETLQQRLKREGVFPETKAREVALQICAGLAQAHRQGVVHGDIKPANVILGRTPEGAMRAVVTDFGMAKLVGEPEQVRGGTRAYMAPELFEGARATVASDIYALGALLRDLGGAAFSRPWKQILLRCQETKPANRPATVEEIIRILEGRRALIKWALVAAVAVIAILAAFLWRSHQDTGPPVRLVVLPVNVEGPAIPSASGLGIDVADRLSGARHNFTVIGPQEAQRNRVDTPEKAKSILGATHVLQTSLRTSGSETSAMATIAEAASGHPLRELQGNYPSADTALIAKALIATVTGAFNLPSRIPQEPTTGPAYQDYIEGVALLRRDGRSADEAIPHFAAAAQLDPHSALPYAGLAEAQLEKSQRGEGAEWLGLAGENIAKAKSLNPDSVPVLLASGLFQQQHGRYEQAIAEYTRVTQLDPQSADAWRRLATAYERTNRTADAIATYQKAIASQPDYYLHYLSFGTFYFRKSQYRLSEEQYREATRVAPSLADGHMGLGLALMQQGKFPLAEKALLASLALKRTAPSLVNLGALYYEEERYPEAVRFFEEAISLPPPSAVRYRDLGDGYRQMKRASDAARAYREGRRLAEADVARNPRNGLARATLALLEARLGDPRDAQFELAQALAMEPENTQALRNAAITYEILGQRDKALAVLRTAPPFLLQEINRQPDVKDLCRDPRFQAMMPKISSP